MASISSHISAIQELFTRAESRGILLWLENGWAIDARLGTILREHGDIDIAFPRQGLRSVLQLLAELGYELKEYTDYGFIALRNDVELDMEYCVKKDNFYSFKGYPPSSCPLAPEGSIDDFHVRCVTWDAMYIEMLLYRHEIPLDEWRAKDHESFRIVESQISPDRRRWLHEHVRNHLLNRRKKASGAGPFTK